MENKKLGQEPAFARETVAIPTYIAGGGEVERGSKGMSKRFYAACAAMQGMLANPKQSKHKSNIFIRFIQLFFPRTGLIWTNSDYDKLIEQCYKFADELLKQENL